MIFSPEGHRVLIGFGPLTASYLAQRQYRTSAGVGVVRDVFQNGAGGCHALTGIGSLTASDFAERRDRTFASVWAAVDGCAAQVEISLILGSVV